MQNPLKIKINVIWDKRFKDGEVLCEMFYKYFCSGELTPFPNNSLSIAVRSQPVEDFGKGFNSIPNYLTVNILLADNCLFEDDPDRVLAGSLEKTQLYIPIAVSKGGCRYIDKAECITAYQNDPDCNTDLSREKALSRMRILLDGEYKNYLHLMLRRTLERIVGKYLYLTGEIDTEKVALFICHTKSTGSKELEFLQQLLTCLTNSMFFVDKNSIELGENLSNKIFDSIKKSTLLVLLTDELSSREWCLKEVACAKQNNRPIVIIDCLRKMDARLYPYFGNCPIIRLDIAKKSGSVLWIYEALLFAVLSNVYGIHKNKYESNVRVLSRPPELLDFINIAPSEKLLVYPEPPLSVTERAIIDKMCDLYPRKISYVTDISAQAQKYMGLTPKIMISSAANPTYHRVDGQCCCVGINYCVREICRYLIYMGCTILNAGNYTKDGFNSVMLEVLSKYTRLHQNNAKYKYYVNGFNIKVNEKQYRDFYAEYKDKNIDFNVFGEDATTESEALKIVRDNITSDADLQIAVGGMIGSGKTGLEKEVELCIEKKKPIYLLGGFGFKTKQLCAKYLTKDNYLQLNNGLSLYDNRKLANEYDIGNILELIFKGYKNVMETTIK